MKCNILLVFFIIILFLTGCDEIPEKRKTQTTKTDVSAQVVNVDQHYWYASGTHYQLTIDLEYNGLDTTIELDGADARRYWDEIHEGDKIKVTLFTTTYVDDGSIAYQYID